MDAPPEETLLSVLRNRLDLTGTKYGCGEGQCGACMVLLDGEATPSCQTPLSEAAGKKIVTIEGLAQNGRLHPVQAAFLEAEAFQCGYCTSGNDRGLCLAPEVELPTRAPKTSRARSRATSAAAEHIRASSPRSNPPPRKGCLEVSLRRDVDCLASELSQHEIETLHWFDVDRRRFLQVLGGGLLVCLAAPEPAALAQESGRARDSHELPKDLAAWLHIDKDGHVTVFTGKVEMGQNIRTSLAQQVAEELRVSVDSIRMVMGDTDLCPWDAGTFGSRTTPTMGPQLRAVAATAREALIDLAAERWKVSRDGLAADNGKIVDAATKQSRSPTAS